MVKKICQDKKDHGKHSRCNLGDKMVEVKDVDLAEDVKCLVNVNPDVKISDELKDKLDKFDNNDLVLITKEIGAPYGLLIKDLELVTEELIAKSIGFR